MKYRIKIRVTGAGESPAKYALNLEEGKKFYFGPDAVGIRLTHSSVSASHCYLHADGGNVIVYDNDSSRGISLNNRRVKQAALRKGDVVQVGEYSLEFLEVPTPNQDGINATQFIDINEDDESKSVTQNREPQTQKTIEHDGINAEEEKVEEPASEPKQVEFDETGPGIDDHAPEDFASETQADDHDEEPAVETASAVPIDENEAGMELPSFPAGAEEDEPSVPNEQGFEAPELEEIEKETTGSLRNKAAVEEYSDVTEYSDGGSNYKDAEDEYENVDDDGVVQEDEAFVDSEDIEIPAALEESAVITRSELATAAHEETLSRNEIEEPDPLPTSFVRRKSKKSKTKKSGSKSKFKVNGFLVLAASAALCGFALANGETFSTTKFAAVMGGIVALCSLLSKLLGRFNEFLEAEGDSSDYFNFFAAHSIFLVPACFAFVVNPAYGVVGLLIAFGIVGFRFYTRFVPLVERFVFIAGVCVSGFAGAAIYFGVLPVGVFNGGPDQGLELSKETKEKLEKLKKRQQATNSNPTKPAPTPESQVSKPNEIVSIGADKNKPTPPSKEKDKITTIQTIPSEPQKPAETQQVEKTYSPLAIAEYFTAIKEGRVDIVKKLIAENKVSVAVKDKEGRSGLIVASIKGDEKMIEFLLEKGADANETDTTGTTALMWTAYRGNERIAAILLKKGAQTSLKKNDGEDALAIAKRWKNGKVEDLIKNPDLADIVLSRKEESKRKPAEVEKKEESKPRAKPEKRSKPKPKARIKPKKKVVSKPKPKPRPVKRSKPKFVPKITTQKRAPSRARKPATKKKSPADSIQKVRRISKKRKPIQPAEVKPKVSRTPAAAKRVTYPKIKSKKSTIRPKPLKKKLDPVPAQPQEDLYKYFDDEGGDEPKDEPKSDSNTRFKDVF